jgi:hypothetical protein
VSLPAGGGGSLKVRIADAMRAIAPLPALRHDTLAAFTQSAVEKRAKGADLSPEEAEALAIVWGPYAKKAERVARKIERAQQILNSGKLLPGEVLGDESSAPEPRAPSEAWFDRWRAGAELASDEHVEEVWSRLLAGEVRRPGRFSLQTLAVLPGIDDTLAESFVRLCTFLIDGWMVPTWSSIRNFYTVLLDIDYSTFLDLESARLLKFTDSRIRGNPGGEPIIMTGASRTWRIGRGSMKVHCLSVAGRELASLVEPAPQFDAVALLGSTLKSDFPTLEIETPEGFKPWPLDP